MINLTGKTINIYAPEAVERGRNHKHQLLRGHSPILSIPSLGFVKPYSSVSTEDLEVGKASWPILVQRYEAVDNPCVDFPNETQFIVTNLYAGVARSLGLLDIELYTIYGLVISGGDCVGCLGLEAK